MAAYRIAEGYKQNDVQVAYIVGFKRGSETNVIDIGNIRFGRKSYYADINIHSKGPLFKRIIQKYFISKILSAVRKQHPDIIHMHNIHGLLTSPSLVVELDRLCVPIVWTLHDMWAFTGHCAYSLGCEKYKTNGCNRYCPYPHAFPPLNKQYVQEEFNRRLRIYRTVKNLYIVSPSKWLANETRKSVLGNIPISVIPNGIDCEVFRPIDKKSARKALGLSFEKRYVLTGGQNIQDSRKGLRYLEKALQRVVSDNLECLIYGRDMLPLSSIKAVRIPVHNMGYVENEYLMRILYSAADLFVIPSIADNLPNVLIEAISCGTPCVGFNVGGIPEVIRNGVTGYLAEYKNGDDLGDKILKILDMAKDEYEQLSKMCRKVAMEEYEFKAQSSKYIKLFESLQNTK